MNHVLKTHYERPIFAAVAFVFLASVGWYWLARSEVRRVRSNLIGVHLAKTVYQPSEWPAASAVKLESWTKPVAQSAGDGWVYELFTPPSVFLNRSTGQFVVTPPSDAGRIAPAFAIELIAVRRELFRLQLRGYFGEPDSYTAVFVQPGNPGAFFAKEGRSLAEHALTLRKFSVQRALPADERSAGGPRRIALAELQDHRTGETVTLNDREPTFADMPVATVKLNSPGGVIREVHTGDIITEGKSVYRVGRVTFSPAEVVVTREDPGGSDVETKVLHPVGSAASTVVLSSAESFSNLPRLATGFVTPEK